MHEPASLLIRACPNPDARVAARGFDLDHPYLEHCWMPLLGPTAVALLRRVPSLWRTGEPARIDNVDLAGQLGIGVSALHRSFDRLEHRRFLHVDSGDQIDVYTTLPPLSPVALAQVPASAVAAHRALLAQHTRPNALANRPAIDQRLNRRTTPSPASPALTR